MLSAKAAEHLDVGLVQVLCEQLRVIAAFCGSDFEMLFHLRFPKIAKEWWTGLDLNQRSRRREIYSLLVLTTHPPVLILVPLLRIELRINAYKALVIPLNYGGNNVVRVAGFKPATF